MVSETKEVMPLCMLEASKHGALVWRNNQGAYEDPRTGRWIFYGVGEGGSDLIGITKDGRFLALEVKIPGWKPKSIKEKERYAKQLNFIVQVKAKGGVGAIVHSAEEVRELLLK